MLLSYERGRYCPFEPSTIYVDFCKVRRIICQFYPFIRHILVGVMALHIRPLVRNLLFIFLNYDSFQQSPALRPPSPMRNFGGSFNKNTPPKSPMSPASYLGVRSGRQPVAKTGILRGRNGSFKTGKFGRTRYFDYNTESNSLLRKTVFHIINVKTDS